MSPLSSVVAGWRTPFASSTSTSALSIGAELPVTATCNPGVVGTGATLTSIVSVVADEGPAWTVSVTVLVPVVEYVWFAWAVVATPLPSPKFQL